MKKPYILIVLFAFVFNSFIMVQEAHSGDCVPPVENTSPPPHRSFPFPFFLEKMISLDLTIQGKKISMFCCDEKEFSIHYDENFIFTVIDSGDFSTFEGLLYIKDTGVSTEGDIVWVEGHGFKFFPKKNQGN